MPGNREAKLRSNAYARNITKRGSAAISQKKKEVTAATIVFVL
jgi:hypothetical protein